MAGDAVGELDEALRRLAEHGPVRVGYAFQPSWRQSRPRGWQWVRSRGLGWSLLALLSLGVFRVFDLVLGLGRKRSTSAERLRLGHGVGVIDLQVGRAAVDFGGYAVLERDGQTWRGRSGRSAATLESNRRRAYDLLWLVDLVRGRTHVEPVARSAEDPPGTDRRAVTCDTAAAARRAGGDIALPPIAGTFAELARIPLDVWLDSRSHALRCIRYRDKRVEATLDVLADGTPATTPEIDWERLPNFEQRSRD